MLDRAEKIPPYRFTAVQYALLAMFLLLAYGLWRLQVSGGERYEQLAQRNRIRGIPVMAPRGKILDREGRILVDNYPSFTVLYQREQGAPSEDDLARMAAGLHMSVEEIQGRLRRRAGEPSFRPAVIKEDITPDELAFVEAHRAELPQLDVIMVHRRLYPRNGFAAHLIGYVGEVSERMLDQPGFELYQAGDIVGQYGVEQTYNHLLMGKDGYRRVVVDSRGREVGQLEEAAATPGRQLRLTIDLDLQIAAEETLEGNEGAIVALDPRNGEVLALASRPTFDPNAFTVGISRQEWSRLVNDPDTPLLNRATQAQLAPGSVFKILMAVAGLEEGIAQKMSVTCPGGKNFYGRFFKCHRVHGGGVDIQRAITESCDTYFYTLAERLGIERIAQYATRYGLGQKTNIDLPQEVAGVMPSEQWKIRTFRQKWYAGETISVGIGQGAVATTPIQLARAIGGIAMDGVLFRPHVAFPDEMQGLAQAAAAREVPDRVVVPIGARNWEIITDAMAGVVNPGGTAASAHLEGIDFAGKTGSSQVVSNEARRKLTGERYRDNGWFVGLAPRRNPEIVVAVLVEGGEHGYVAARLAAQVIKAHFDKKQRNGVKVAEGRSPAQPPGVEVAAVWGEAGPPTGTGRIRTGRFDMSLSYQSPPRPGKKQVPSTESSSRQFDASSIPQSP
ncbi:MAG TPA: penicillin-binding protein 2 [Terriglobales bacterium]|nr:penicillin-binding protein 2 [Terriglobales bacterium]